MFNFLPSTIEHNSGKNKVLTHSVPLQKSGIEVHFLPLPCCLHLSDIVTLTFMLPCIFPPKLSSLLGHTATREGGSGELVHTALLLQGRGGKSDFHWLTYK